MVDRLALNFIVSNLINFGVLIDGVTTYEVFKC